MNTEELEFNQQTSFEFTSAIPLVKHTIDHSLDCESPSVFVYRKTDYGTWMVLTCEIEVLSSNRIRVITNKPTVIKVVIYKN
jgi:hypothetical protein